MLLTRCSD